MMTRKHYKMIAAAIAEEHGQWGRHEPEATAALNALAQRLASGMAGDNPNFDRERFLTACEGR